jgi:hypothetical protein
MKKFILLGLIFFVLNTKAQTVAQKESIALSATVNENPPGITLQWPLDAGSENKGYRIFKREKGSKDWGNAIATPLPADTLYTDNQLSLNKNYEYYIDKNNGVNLTAIGYLSAGINLEPNPDRGMLVLLIDSAYKYALEAEIKQLEMDILGDGWQLLKHYVNRNASVSDVKQLIIQDYNTYPQLRTVFILGHVPVPYSGRLSVPPDGHVVGSGDHTGAWAADGYYGDMDGAWTDLYYDTSASRSWNKNIPGDGKFDQNYFPSELELEVGRVDLYNMPEFSANDTALIKYYLEKLHNFKMGKVQAEKRGLIDDNFKTLNLVSTGWRYFPGFFGQNKIDDLDYFSTMKNKSYLWSCGAGAGSFNSCNGLKNNARAYTKDFANDTIQSVFTMLSGSFFGDWDNKNNFLRAPLASKTMALVSFWGGIPQWILHHMAMGETIGHAARITMNNTGDYYHGYFNYSANKIHIGLMGDPTLKMHTVQAPSHLSADSIANVTVKLTWNASPDKNISGYNIFRTHTLNEAFIKINENPVSDTTYTDAYAMNGNNVYMVRAVKKEISGGGSYFNMSLGIFDSASTLWNASVQNKDMEHSVQIYPNPVKDMIHIHVYQTLSGTLQISLFDVYGREVAEMEYKNQGTPNTINFPLTGMKSGTYILKIHNRELQYVGKIIIN